MLQVGHAIAGNDQIFLTQSKGEYQVVCRRKITRRVLEVSGWNNYNSKRSMNASHRTYIERKRFKRYH
jgi:hypothetical protein